MIGECPTNAASVPELLPCMRPSMMHPAAHRLQFAIARRFELKRSASRLPLASVSSPVSASKRSLTTGVNPYSWAVRLLEPLMGGAECSCRPAGSMRDKQLPHTLPPPQQWRQPRPGEPCMIGSFVPL